MAGPWRTTRNNPSTYEIHKPEDFCFTRYVSLDLLERRQVSCRAAWARTHQGDQDAIAKIKELVDLYTQAMDDVSSLLRILFTT